MDVKTLSERRREVLNMILDGMTPRQIARELDLSTQTIYYHLNGLRELGFLPRKESAA